MSDEHRRPRRQIDAHFDADLGPRDEAEMRAHLEGCAACRAYYERHLVLARLDPAALPRAQRLGHALGLGRPARAWLRPVLIAAPALAAITLFVGVAGRGGLAGRANVSDPTSSGFTARSGPADTRPALVVYRVGDREHPATRVRRGDELAFAYRNPGGAARLMVFGVDEHHHVYWYYPAWPDAKTDPAAIAITRGIGATELPEAIAQPLDGAHLTVYGLFTDESPHVHAVDAQAQAGEPQPGTGTLTRTELQVDP